MKPNFHAAVLSLASATLALVLLVGCAGQNSFPLSVRDDKPCVSKGWPHDHSDLEPDPSLLFGVLENGLRYVIMENHEPEDRVGLYLDIQAGSLHETDAQRGYAHFLEHMLFNGTTHFPAGTLVEYFQSIGMSFGSDSNAHTTFDETVYRLLLPDGSTEHLQKGLLVMADYARGALLLEDEVERERGIILSEKRTRDSVDYRLYERKMQFSFAGTRVAERLPIGTEDALVKANASMLRSFYDNWYRPDNMILVIVGDVDPPAAAKMVAQQFAALAAPPVSPACFDYGTIDEAATTALYVHEPDLGKTEVSIGARWNTVPHDDSLAWQAEFVRKYIVGVMLNNRLKRLVSQPGSPMTKADSYSGIFLNRFGYSSLSGYAEGGRWEATLFLLDHTLRQALESGFTERELNRAKKEAMAQLEKSVQTAGGRDSRKLADQIIDKLNRNEVFLSPRQDLELFGPVVEGMSLAEANTLLRTMWAPAGREIIVAGTAQIDAAGTSPEEVILQVFRQSQKQDPGHWDNGERLAFPYLDLPEGTAKIVRQDHLQGVGIEKVEFANGTTLQIKHTDYQPNQVLVAVHFGQGRQAESRPGMAMVAESVVNEGGVGALTHAELDEALAGHTVEVSFRVGQESFFFNGSGLKDELELLFQLLLTRLLDPAFRQEAYQLSMERFSQMFDQRETSVEGALQLQGERFLAGGNSRYGVPPRSEFMNITMDEVRDWLAPLLRQGPLEISVVGDVQADEVIRLAARYFGAMTRDTAPVREEEVLEFPVGQMLKVQVPTVIDKALLVLAWPTDDFWDISRTRRLNILAGVLDDRLRVEIREKLGAVYSPVVYNQPSKVAPGYGVLRGMITVDPARTEELAEQVIAVASDLAKHGVGEEELRRSLGPSLTSIKDLKKTNRYWLDSVLTLASRHPEQLAWPLTIEQDFSSITSQDISEYAARYLQPARAAKLLFIPSKQQGN